jgi:hypothetical protein
LIQQVKLCPYIEFEFPFVINSKYKIKKGNKRYPLLKIIFGIFTSNIKDYRLVF